MLLLQRLKAQSRQNSKSIKRCGHFVRLLRRSTDLDRTDLGNIVCSLIFNTLSSDCWVYFLVYNIYLYGSREYYTIRCLISVISAEIFCSS